MINLCLKAFVDQVYIIGREQELKHAFPIM